jgi:tetratricopeptide (TPR) repeat protein
MTHAEMADDIPGVPIRTQRSKHVPQRIKMTASLFAIRYRGARPSAWHKPPNGIERNIVTGPKKMEIVLAITEDEATLLDAQPRDSAGIAHFINFARLADTRKDWAEAERRWQVLREHFPHALHGYVGSAVALRELNRLDEAEKILLEATKRFPQEIIILHDLARVAERRADWVTAEGYWRACLVIDSDPWWVLSGLATALREQGRTTEAEAVLLDAQARHPHEIAYFIDHARVADKRRDWAESERRWHIVLGRFPDSFHGYVGLAVALSEQGQSDEADNYLRVACARFPTQVEPYHVLAILASRRGDWKASEYWWRQEVAIDANGWRGYVGLAEALRRLELIGEARSVLLEAQERCPNVPEVFAELSRLEIDCLDWERAEQAVQVLCKRFPTRGQGYVIGSEVLQRQFRFEDARRLLANGLNKADDTFDVMIALAHLHSRDDIREYSAAFDCLEQARQRYPDRKQGYAVGIRFLRNAGRSEDAAALAIEAVRRWPHDEVFAQEHARLGDLDRGLAERLTWFTAIKHHHPEISAGYIGLAIALERAGNALEAEVVLAEATRRFPNNMEVAIEAVRLAEQRDDWASAVRQLGELQLRFAGDKRISNRLFVAKLRVAESGISSENNALATASVTEVVGVGDIVMQFESMGGTGGGCEFGLFQRDHGAEPLGLLRWTTITPDSLIAALESRFDGVGLPQNTTLHPEEDSKVRQEFITEDRNFGLRMHTFVYTDEEDRSRFYNRICRRLQFLRRKLIDDLAAGEKIFVYKIVERELEDEEIDQIHQAMRSYGDNTMLYVRYADAAHPDGMVVAVRPGLLVGYIDHFQMSRAGEVGAVVTHSWRAICYAAYQLWQSGRGDIGSSLDFATAS